MSGAECTWCGHPFHESTCSRLVMAAPVKAGRLQRSYGDKATQTGCRCRRHIEGRLERSARTEGVA